MGGFGGGAGVKPPKYGVPGGVGTGLGPGGVPIGGTGFAGGPYSAAAKAAKYGVGTGGLPGGFPVGAKAPKYVVPGVTPYTPVTFPNGSVVPGQLVPGKPAKDVSGTPQPGVSGGIVQPSPGTGVVGTGVDAPVGVDTSRQVQPGPGVGTVGKAPKPFIPGIGYPYGPPYGVPLGTGTGPGTGPGTGTLPGAKPLKPPVVGGAGERPGIPLAAGGYQGGVVYPGGAAKAPKPGYGNIGGGGGYQQGVVPGYRGGYPQQYYQGAGLMLRRYYPGYVPAPLTPQQAKAAKYGPLQGFLGGGGGGGIYRGGVAGCQGKYCGRRK